MQYILHENTYLRDFIWKKIDFHNIIGTSTFKLVIYTLLIAIIIFAMGLIIDKIFKFIVSKTCWNRNLLEFIDDKSNKIWNKFQTKVLN